MYSGGSVPAAYASNTGLDSSFIFLLFSLFSHTHIEFSFISSSSASVGLRRQYNKPDSYQNETERGNAQSRGKLVLYIAFGVPLEADDEEIKENSTRVWLKRLNNKNMNDESSPVLLAYAADTDPLGLAIPQN